METLVADDSPLAAYLEGRGEADHPSSLMSDEPQRDAQLTETFAPRGLPVLRFGTHKIDVRPLLRRRWMARIMDIYESSCNIILGKEGNERFLEHFRYTLIASQLLSENGNTSATLPSHSSLAALENATSDASLSLVSGTFTGAVLSAAFGFALVWMIHWSRAGPSGTFSKTRLIFVSCITGLAIASIYLFLRREWLQRLRRQAISTASSLVTNIQSFEASTTSLLTLIQEVELVSRGYRISCPLPPVSRIEASGQQRKCLRLRRNLDMALSKALPSFLTAATLLRELVDDNDLERYYDVYDIRSEDLQDAFSGYDDADLEGNETVRQLRIHQHRFNTLRRVLICSLLALPASSQGVDLQRWQTVINEMDNLRLLIGEQGLKLVELIKEDDHTVPESTLRSPVKTRNSMSHRRVQLQVRKISTLSSGIRSLQAKIYLLREDSNRTLSTSDSESDISELGASLMDQYESIGMDLKALMQAWESGKLVLAQNIDWHERRLSRASSTLLSPTSSLGGLTVVDEDTGGPMQALKLLNGDVPLSPPSTDYGEASPSEDDEVFEAIALPKARSTLTREQRIAKMHKERERQASVKEKRFSNTILIKELESVIKLRPTRTVNGRTTSV